MTTKIQSMWQALVGSNGRSDAPVDTIEDIVSQHSVVEAVDIAPNDPIVGYFQTVNNVVEIDKLTLDSPAVQALREAGVKIAVPLLSQGELIGLLNLGPRLSEQEYSTDDRRLLSNLATQAAPAVRVAQLARQQQSEAQARERIEQELRVASVIQQTLLPQSVPEIEDWEMRAFYKPAREVGGDFYDFLELAGGKLGVVVGDVTDKGVPAALVMATTRGILRAASERSESPGAVLRKVNDMLYPDIPAKMFVTCLYAIVDTTTGKIHYANAGHDLPYRRTETGIDELRATGMPLGLMPGMEYEEREVTLAPGESVLLYSDGLVEAHNETREMYGFPRLKGLVATHEGGASLIDALLSDLTKFTGPDLEQEDDVTLVTIRRTVSKSEANPMPTLDAKTEFKSLDEFLVQSQPGNERQAMERVADAVKNLDLPTARLEKLKTAVAEGTMNAMEHGNKYDADTPVSIVVAASEAAVSVKIIDSGGVEEADKSSDAETPDLVAKLAGLQSPRGWGLFLIKEMVDEFKTTSDDKHHNIELIMNLGGGEDGNR